MSDRPTDGGELTPNETYIAYSGRCRITRARHAQHLDKLLCVAPNNAYVLVDFTPGEEHAFDRMQWRNKDGSHAGGFVIRTAEGDAYLMPHLFEEVCEVIREKASQTDRGGQANERQRVSPTGEVIASPPSSRPVRVVNVKGLNKPDQRAGIVYVGRKFAGWAEHPLHNPFKPKDGEPVGTCIAKYKSRLLARFTLDDDLAELWRECQQGRKPLGCWCVAAQAGDGSEVVCHGQVLAELLQERFGAK